MLHVQLLIRNLCFNYSSFSLITNKIQGTPCCPPCCQLVTSPLFIIYLYNFFSQLMERIPFMLLIFLSLNECIPLEYISFFKINGMHSFCLIRYFGFESSLENETVLNLLSLEWEFYHLLQLFDTMN